MLVRIFLTKKKLKYEKSIFITEVSKTKNLQNLLNQMEQT